jgi:hypothetical protein
MKNLFRRMLQLKPMHGLELDLNQLMWDVYNAHGPNGGEDVTHAIRHYPLTFEQKKSIVERIKLSPFLTPMEIRKTILEPIIYNGIKLVK